jgi:hypothetical protein
MGLPPTRQPHRLDGLAAYLASGHGIASVAAPGGLVRTHPFALTSPVTWENAGPHSAEPLIPDKDDATPNPLSFA